MAIMSCYNDQRTIENELGGKWELVLDADIVANKGVEYKADEFGNPLQLNGVKLIVECTTSNTLTTYINNKNLIRYTKALSFTSTNKIFAFDAICKNGYCTISLRGPYADSTSTTTTVTCNRSFFTEFIDYFKLINTADCNVKVYFLRGV